MSDILTGKLKNYRDEFDNEFQHWYDFVVRIREDLGVEHSVPLLGNAVADRDQISKTT